MQDQPSRPSITPAQIIAVLIAGVPVIAQLLAAFSVYTLTDDQQKALTDALTWCGVLAGALIVADAGLRSARNAAVAKITAASTPAQAVPGSDESEPGDPDALPDYETAADTPPDIGDRHAAAGSIA